MKLGRPLFEKKGAQTCDHTPRYAKVPSFEKYVAYYFYDAHIYMFVLTYIYYNIVIMHDKRFIILSFYHFIILSKHFYL